MLTERQQEIKVRLDSGLGAREIADDLGISRNAVYQQIQRMRRAGQLASDYTPTGQPVREKHPQPGADALMRLLAAPKHNGNGADEAADAQQTGALALVELLRTTRDELSTITRRLDSVIPR